ncbi:MAG TPA: hypothetical protein VLH60_07290 [Sedimentisphaerales bacterium]|nr:hypothetical protein [Sedimentisphaerales bacterium]
MKQKHHKIIGLRRVEKEKARRKGIQRLIILSACAAALAVFSLVILVRQDVPDSPLDPNGAIAATPEA